MREHQQHERHIIATRCIHFSLRFLDFSVQMTATTPGHNTLLSPDCDGKRSENAYFLGPSAAPVYCCSPAY